MSLILHCVCGARVPAPDATPGRVGLCPRCGALLRVPDTFEPEPVGAPGPDPVAVSDLTDGYDLAPEPGAPRVRRPAPPSVLDAREDEGEHPPRPRKPRRPEDRGDRLAPGDRPPLSGGLRSAPRSQERGFLSSLAYPLWGTDPMALLAILVPACAVTSVFSVGLRDYVIDGNQVERMGALLMILPMALLLLTFLASGCRYLEQVVASTGAGEVPPPKKPGLDMFESLNALIRWAFAVGPGLVLTSLAASRLQGPIAGLVAGSGLALGALPIAGIAILGDAGAASPLMALRALALTGLDGLRILAAFGLAGALVGAGTSGLFLLPSAPAIIAGVLTFWVAFWYGAIVLARRLGLYYRRHARALHWARHDDD